MTASAPKTTRSDITCPDPSLHEHDTKLQDQASRAALSVTSGHEKQQPEREVPALGPDGKLSSAGAAASLKHAKPQDLPGFPIVGIDANSSGHQAATLANKNQKPFEHWKPDQSSSAGKAALLAHRDGGKLDLWQPSSSDAGHSAAGLAMGKKLSPQLDYGYTDDGKKKALLAASLSVSGKGSSTAASGASTASYPDARNSAYNALNAASVANRPQPTADSRKPAEPQKMSSPALEAARVQHSQNIPREMYTERPPVAIEVEEKKHQAALRASAVSMAKQMQAAQQSRDNGPSTDVKSQAKNYLSLQEAAQKLAAERLAKLDPDGVAAYREHYGYKDTAPKSKLSIRRGQRGSSDQDSDSEDEVKAGRIRQQMGKLNDELASADAKKRTKDRQSLMAAAENAVKARMHSMDQQVFEETGKVSPAMMEEWEAKARARAAADSEKRMETHGKVHIGGGKYMDQSEVNAIAASRLQPTLDDINSSAEKSRAREEEIRLDTERKKEEQDVEKHRDKEVKVDIQRQRDLDKQAAKREKEEERVREKDQKEYQKLEKRLQKEQIKTAQDQERAGQEELKRRTLEDNAAFKREAEQKRLAEKREADQEKATQKREADEAKKPDALSKPFPVTKQSSETTEEAKQETKADPSPGEAAAINPTTEGMMTASNVVRSSSVLDPPGVPTTFDHEPPAIDSGALTSHPVNPPSEPTSPQDKASKRDSRVRSFLGRFKRQSRPASDGAAVSAPEEESLQSPKSGEEGLYSEPSNTEPAAVDKGKGRAKSSSPSISSLSSDEETPKTKKLTKRGRARKSTKSEDEEARDTFDDENLNVPPSVSVGGKSSKDGSPARTSSKFQEEL
ncbi:MAG: hypothetical protein M1828_005479 [Chrysothrix sp. TS-e1954]|nr:MAG: hypothetical protein M1828_005479 [Chrysothrix sp. TS-e1954]